MLPRALCSPLPTWSLAAPSWANGPLISAIRQPSVRWAPRDGVPHKFPTAGIAANRMRRTHGAVPAKGLSAPVEESATSVRPPWILTDRLSRPANRTERAALSMTRYVLPWIFGGELDCFSAWLHFVFWKKLLTDTYKMIPENFPWIKLTFLIAVCDKVN